MSLCTASLTNKCHRPRLAAAPRPGVRTPCHACDRHPGRRKGMLDALGVTTARSAAMAEQAQTFKIAKIPADGVGREVVEAGQRVLDCVAGQSGGKLTLAWEEFPWGCEYYDKTGRMMAEDGLEILKGFDAIYFGAVGWANVPDHISLWGLRLNITQNFDQWANVR